MPLVRTKKDPGDFFIMSKGPVDDANLSWKAKGLLAYLMSKPDDWQIWVKDLVKRSADGRDAVLSGLNELIGQRYARREQPRRKDGTLGSVEYVVYESPQTGFPYTDKPLTENPTYTNNNHTNNNQGNNEKKDFLSQTPKPDRERIRDLLIDVLADGVIPESDFLIRPFEAGVDTLVLEFRKMYDKKRLDPDLTSKILAAIRGAYEDEDNWQFDRADTPTTPVIACIVAEGRQGPKQEDARAEWQEASQRSQEALAERQAAPERPGDLWWGRVLGELSLGMTKPAFDTYLKDTKLLTREGGTIRVGVRNGYSLDWIKHRLHPTIERTLEGFGVERVEFEVIT